LLEHLGGITMKLIHRLLPAAVLVACGLFAGSASADCGGGFGVGNCWFGNFNAFGAGGTLYGSGYLPVPPYYSIHPPVYYSHQYYRPYGWSPFAQSAHGGVATPRPEPRMVVNPHVPAPARAVDKKPDQTVKSQMIVNPYVVQSETTGQGRLASSPR
jgi:hypothetical protein